MTDPNAQPAPQWPPQEELERVGGLPDYNLSVATARVAIGDLMPPQDAQDAVSSLLRYARTYRPEDDPGGRNAALLVEVSRRLGSIGTVGTNINQEGSEQ